MSIFAATKIKLEPELSYEGRVKVKEQVLATKGVLMTTFRRNTGRMSAMYMYDSDDKHILKNIRKIDGIKNICFYKIM